MSSSDPHGWQRALHVVATLVGAALLGWLALRALAHLRATLTVLALGATLAFVLAPAANALHATVGRRSLAVLILLAGGFALLAGGVVAVLGPLVRDLAGLVGRLPAYTARVEGWFDGIVAWLAEQGLLGAVEDALDRSLGALQGRASDLLSNLLASAVALLGALGNLLAVLLLAAIIAAYLLIDAPRIRDRALGLVPPRWRAPATELEAIVARVVGGYLRGQLLLGLLIGLAAGLGSALLGLPYPVLLGVIAGVFELIPTVGAVLGAIPAVAFAAFEPFPRVLYTAAFFAALQQVEGTFLVPRITGRAVGLHPVAALLSLFGGFEVGGVAGAILAVPATAIAWEVFLAFARPRARPPGKNDGEAGGTGAAGITGQTGAPDDGQAGGGQEAGRSLAPPGHPS